MLTDRRKIIMKIIVEEYVKTAEPVGSKALLKLEKLQCSSATIRAEMSHLEDIGFLEKTHTSSGRVPSEEGYRFYVHNLMDVNSEEKKTYEVIDEVLTKNVRKEEIIEESIKLISKITNYASFATGEDAEALIKKVELVQIGEFEGLVLIVISNGNVKSEKISIPVDIEFEEMNEVIHTISKIIYETRICDVSNKLKSEVDTVKVREYIEFQEVIIRNFIDMFSKFSKDNRFYQSSHHNMLKLPEFSDVNKVRELMKTIENKEVFKSLEGNSELSIKIGSEVDLDSMSNDDIALISVPYEIGNEKGKIAVMGPKRMDYEKVIPLLEYISNGLKKL